MALNFYECGSYLTITATSLEWLAVFDDTYYVDTGKTFYGRTSLGYPEEGYIRAGDEGSTWTEDTTLATNQEVANALCRAEYDDNEIWLNYSYSFCCQAFRITGTDTDLILAYINSEYYTYYNTNTPVSILDNAYEVTWGAETFASARELGASLAALAAAALVYTQ